MLMKKYLTSFIVFIAMFIVIQTQPSMNVFAESAVSMDDRAQTIVVELNDDYFNPKIISIPNGKTTTLVLKNKGTKEHTFTVKMLNIDVELQPGKETTINVTPKQPNTYELTCRYHLNVGMVGKVIVK